MKRNKVVRRLLLAFTCTVAVIGCSDDKKGSDSEAGPVDPESVGGTCERTIVADVATLSNLIVYNRLGTLQTGSQIFALVTDVEVAVDKTSPWQWLPDTQEWKDYESCRDSKSSSDPTCVAALDNVAKTYFATGDHAVRVRPDHRPRPIVLRANQGDCLEVNQINLLPDQPEPTAGSVNTAWVGFHPVGMPLVNSITNDGQLVGRNPNSLLPPGNGGQYLYYASEEAIHFLSSSTDENDGQLNAGLFGAIHVQPKTAEYYRSQVTREDLGLATTSYNSDGTPQIDYQATFTAADPDRPWRVVGQPILNMLEADPNHADRFNLLYSDLTAIITGPLATPAPGTQPGFFAQDNPSPSLQQNEASPDRRQPFREFAIVYHEPGGAIQAFQDYFGPGKPLQETLDAGKDAFGINYGTGGIGAEIVANRLQVGPMANCVDCRYEEFFLTSWAVGDPAMNVDIPANIPGMQASAAKYPDDPSNVYHSYLGDHVKMRVHHGGAIHHLHHLHAHQWLHSPNSDEGHYLDSQLIGPGSSFNLEITHNGSGNRNQTVGDSIFHCHFYPHFAQGMWGLWRVHDVYEAGTELENKSFDSGEFMVPKAGSRALPDGEIALGTPIPGLVPLPSLPIAPVPGQVSVVDGQPCFDQSPGGTGCSDRWGEQVPDGYKNPGYPFFIPGIAGSRPSHPPLDIAKDETGKELDGGLPRHVVLTNSTFNDEVVHYENKYDFSKFSPKLDAMQLPEVGTKIEQLAMAAHANRRNPTHTPEGQAAEYIYNGMPAQPGAPFADPCYDVPPSCEGNPNACDPSSVITAQNPLRHYSGADIQYDVVLNKEGWHYPQQRLIVLWNDIQDTFDNVRPPEPFFFRANSNQCIEYWMTNLVPNYYELDNFQVRTPTDILGQHIHLVKFDVTSSDGAANGFNYEDGTFSYEEVQDRIEEIDEGGGLLSYNSEDRVKLPGPETPQFLCDAGVENCARFAGAQVTIQRWWADPLLNNAGHDRTIRTVFTHDHFGPSTHQQAGLYAGLLVEPTGSTWWDAENPDTQLGAGRPDGGPTSWQAVIRDQSGDSYREFALEFQDLALAYAAGGANAATPYPRGNESKDPGAVTTQNNTLNGLDPSVASDQKQIRTLVGGFIYDQSKTSGKDKSSKPVAAPDIPQVISSPKSGLWGTYSVNYRQEPLGLRAQTASEDGCGTDDITCDNAYLFGSLPRSDQALNEQPSTPPVLTSGVYDWDPMTPVLRAYEGERVQIRTLVGAHVQMHNFMVNGMSWLFEPSNTSSGFRDSQSMGISEHFEMNFTMPPATTAKVPDTVTINGQDYSPGAPSDTCESGTGADAEFADYLYTTSATTAGLVNGNWGLIRSYKPGTANCLTPVDPASPPTTSDWKCPEGAAKRKFKVTASNVALTYNEYPDGSGIDTIQNQFAIAYTGCDATAGDCTPPAPSSTMQPLVLRAAAGECIEVELTNGFDKTSATFTDSDTPLTVLGSTFFADSVSFADVEVDPSANVRLYPQMLAFDPRDAGGNGIGFNQFGGTPVDGAAITQTWYAGRIESDGSGTPIEFGVVNLFAADPLMQSSFGLVGALVVEPEGATWDASAADPTQVSVTVGGESFHDIVLITTDHVASTGTAGVILANYGTAPITPRFDAAEALLPKNPTINPACQYTDLGNEDPGTPVFTVNAGDPVRFRVVHPWGLDQQVFELFGHIWQEEPYNSGSTVFASNRNSEYQGFREGWGATDRLNVIIPSAGGPAAVAGDYLYRLRDVASQATFGVWGIFRVLPAGQTNPPAVPPIYPPCAGLPTAPPTVAKRKLSSRHVPPPFRPQVPAP